MVDLPLEQFQSEQSSRIAGEIIGQSQEHEKKLQANAQQRWEKAHQQLVAILRLLDQDYDESCQKAHHSLDTFGDEDLAFLIHVRLRALQAAVSRTQRPDATIELTRSLKELQQRFADLEQKLNTAQESTKTLLAEKSALEAHLSALRQVQKVREPQDQRPSKKDADVPETAHPIPDWIGTWRCSKVFEKTSTAILVMGEQGIALRPAIKKAMAKRLSLPIENNSLDEAINRLLNGDEHVTPCLIEKIEEISEAGSSSGGNHPDVLRLSVEGTLAYQILTGKQPQQNEYDRLIRWHSSPAHTILNIQAAEALSEAGYMMNGQVQEIRLSNGGTFIPDISAVDPTTGELIFVEVERNVHKDKMGRKQKWINLYEASNGNLYVFCDNLSGQRAIQGEINLALGGLNYNSYLTNLHGLRNGKRSEKDDSIWLSVKRGKP